MIYFSDFSAGGGSYTADDAIYSMSVLIAACCGLTAATHIVDESVLLAGQATRQDNAQISSTGGPIGTGSVRLDGSNDSFRWAHNDAYRLGTSDFAIMLTVLVDATWTSTDSNIVGHSLVTGNQRGWRLDYEGATGEFVFVGSSDGTASTELLRAAIPSFAGDTDYTMLIEREGGTFRLFAGPLAGTMTCIDEQSHPGFDFFDATSPLWFGFATASGSALKGNISEIYIYKGGTIRHSNASFSTPTTRYPRTDTPVTTPIPTFANVKLLVQGHTPDASTSATDQSGVGRTLTVNGNAQTDTGITIDGQPTWLLDGTGDYITAPDANDLDLSVGSVPEWCIEAKARFAVGSRTNTLVNKRPGGTASAYSIAIDTTDRISFATFNGGAATLALSAGAALSTATDYHIAVCRKGSIIRIFRDGIMRAIAIAGTIQDNTALLHLGRDGFNTGRDWNGSVGAWRLSHEHTYADGDFTPPTLPLPTS